eukprot:gene112-347_t
MGQVASQCADRCEIETNRCSGNEVSTKQSDRIGFSEEDFAYIFNNLPAARKDGPSVQGSPSSGASTRAPTPLTTQYAQASDLTCPPAPPIGSPIGSPLAAPETRSLKGARSAEDFIAALREGNVRYLSRGLKLKGGGEQKHRDEIGSGQAPSIAILGCADSRVPPEVVFDLDAGESFTVRVAGNVVTADGLASLEYAYKHLKTKFFLVLGHAKCGAVCAACGDQKGIDGHLPSLMARIRPCCKDSKDPIRKNVEVQVGNLADGMANCAGDSGLIIRGGIFDLDTGCVEFL